MVFAKYFLGTFLSCAMIVFLMVIYANPWGNYGNKKFIALYNARLAKADYLESLTEKELPEWMILGSSNSYCYNPKTFEKTTRKRTFNFGVFWGKAEDYYCAYRFVADDLGHDPEMLVVVLDTWSVRALSSNHLVFPGTRRRLLNTPQLVKYLPTYNPVKLYWSRLIDLFSHQQISISFTGFIYGRKRLFQDSMEKGSGFRKDGSRAIIFDFAGGKEGDIMSLVHSGEYPITSILKKRIASGKDVGFPVGEYNFKSFDPGRVKMLTDLVKLSKERGTQILFILNPVHPVFGEKLAKETPYLDHLKKLRLLLSELEKANDNVKAVVDASQLEFFGGSPQLFYDAIHIAEPNCDRIIQKALSAAGIS